MDPNSITANPFLLVQVGDYGHAYENEPLPVGLVPLARDRESRGVLTYPKNPNLPPPSFHVPSDVHRILMNKSDELTLNGVAYWAQSLNTRFYATKGCINSTPSELLEYSRTRTTSSFWALLVTKRASVSTKVSQRPKGHRRGNVFRPWMPSTGKLSRPAKRINTSIVYTEKNKQTLVFETLEVVGNGSSVDLREFHVHCTSVGEAERMKNYEGKRLSYRPSGCGTCSLVAPGRPDQGTEIPHLREQQAVFDVVAVATLHADVCGYVYLE